jgi:cell division protein FtsB
MAKKDVAKLVIIGTVVFFIFLPSFAKYQELSYKNRMLDEKVRSLKEETKRLEEVKKRLLTDITYIEKRAREKIGVVRKGEMVIKEEPAKK